MPVVSIVMYGKMQSLDMLPKSWILIFLFDEIIQTILDSFSITIFEASCIGMLSCENDTFKFLEKLQKGQTARASHVL